MLVRHSITSRLAAPVVALCAAVACIGISGCSLVLEAPGVIEPSIVPVTAERGSRMVAREFAFEDGRVRLSVPVDRSVYAGATNSEKSAIFVGKADPGDWVPDYYRA